MIIYITAVSKYKTFFFIKSRELRKLLRVLNLFVITIDFTILSLRKRFNVCF